MFPLSTKDFPPKVYVTYLDDIDQRWEASFPSRDIDHARQQFNEWAAREGVIEVRCIPLNLKFPE